MLDHINLPVCDLARSAELYIPVMGSLDLVVLYRDDEVVGFGKDSWIFGLVQETKPFVPMHVAFAADSQQSVAHFYNTALQFGGIDNGAPGLRPEYGRTYFAAFVLDFDGHNIEALIRN